MKEREDRQSVFISARMRWDGCWQAANVRNVSAHGLLVAMAEPPAAGTYVEVQIGKIMLAARSVWSSGLTCGLRSRDFIDVASLQGPRTRPPAKSAAKRGPRPVAEKYQPPARLRHEQSRWLSAMMQYATFLAVAVCAASGVAWEVHKTLSASTDAIGEALAPNIHDRARSPE